MSESTFNTARVKSDVRVRHFARHRQRRPSPPWCMLLDLSSAFDTVDHHILLQRLELTLGVGHGDMALSWFNSYLVGRRQQVRTGRLTSALSMILSQGSVLGPILFLLYTADLLSLIDDCGLQAHLYADDTQLYGFCPQSESHDLPDAYFLLY